MIVWQNFIRNDSDSLPEFRTKGCKKKNQPAVSEELHWVMKRLRLVYVGRSMSRSRLLKTGNRLDVDIEVAHDRKRLVFFGQPFVWNSVRLSLDPPLRYIWHAHLIAVVTWPSQNFIRNGRDLDRISYETLQIRSLLKYEVTGSKRDLINHHRADRRVEGGRRNGWLGGFAKVDNRFGYEKWT